MKLNSRIQKGNRAEAYAVKYLKKQQYRIIKRNFSCNSGEIDIIAYDTNQKELAFIEVRFRQTSLQDALFSINHSKQKKITRTAQFYLHTHSQFADCFARFDVIALSFDQKQNWLIEHIQNAFGL